MGKTATNLSIILGLITVAFGAYYMYTQHAMKDSSFVTDEKMLQDMLNETRVFMQNTRVLDEVDLEIELLEDVRFITLKSFSTPLLKPQKGRPDPFAPVTQSRVVPVVTNTQ